ncbi:MAG: LPXTG cell wall anchor domain-containing protein [Actinomycetota bacterium]
MGILRIRNTRGVPRSHAPMAPQRLGAMLLAILLALFIVGPTAFAVHDEGLFELDGDATASGAPGADWSNTGSAIATAFVTDGQAPEDETYLHTGDSKDIKDFDEWVPTTTDEAPDKDEILHAFAAGYNNADGDLIVYFGLDRFDASGDAQVGFWFAQSNVSIVGSSVVGDHQVGDILVLSDFVNGGSVPDIRVFKWVGSGGSDGPIDEVTTSGDPDCNAADPGDDLCALINADIEDAPWPFLDKSKSTDFLPGEFYEGGVNLTELGIDQGCITTFIAESRTSQSTDARLKDVAIGGFPLCGISVTKTGDAQSKVGDQAHYTVEIENTGAITLYKESIIDDVLGNLTDGSDANITSSTCGASLVPGASCTIQLTYTVQADDPDPLVNTVDIVYDNKANLTGSNVSDSDGHSTQLFQPSIRVVKGGDPQSKVGDNVHYTFEITNTSSSDAPDLIMDSISDSLLGNLADDAPAACDQIASGDSCSFTADRVVQADDPNPLPNTVTVHYHPEGFPNDISDTDDHSVDLFGPSVTITKGGDTLGKVTDNAHYTFEIENTSSDNSPDLILDSISDSLLGDLEAAAVAAGCDTLSPGDTCNFTADRVVQAGDPDPLPNTVTVHYHPEGFPNDISATDDHSVNLFQPSVVVEKDGDGISTAGENVHYTFAITNTSSDDSPDLDLESVTDSLLGDLTAVAEAADCGTLAPGDSCEFAADRVVQGDDPNPLPNTVTVLFHPEGFPNDISDTDDHSVDLFGPSVTITKGGDTLGKVTDNAHYTFEIENTSSDNSPDLVLDSISDSLLGDLEAAAVAAGCDTLSPGDKCNFTADRVVQAGDPDPLPNTVTVHFHPEGFVTDIMATDDHAVNLFQPSVTVDKAGPATVTVGQPLTYTFTINNTSSEDSPALELASMTDVGNGWAGLGDLTDEAVAADCGSLDPGGSCQFQVTITAPASPSPLENTVSVLYHPDGFPNDITDSDSHSLGLVQVLGNKILPKTGTDVGLFMALGIALVLAGLGLRYLVTYSPDEAA